MVFISSCEHFKDPITGSWGGVGGDEVIFKEDRKFEWQHVEGTREEGRFHINYKFPFHLQLQTSKEKQLYRYMFVRGTSFNKIRIMKIGDNKTESINWDRSRMFERITRSEK